MSRDPFLPSVSFPFFSWDVLKIGEVYLWTWRKFFDSVFEVMFGGCILGTTDTFSMIEVAKNFF